MTKQVRQLDRVVIRFAGDSGDGMQLTGDRFTSETAQLGNDISTLPNFPAEIRAPAGTLPGVSSFQVHFADFDILTPGDAPNVLVAMNPAALKANLADLPGGADIIVNTDEFTKRNLTKVGYAANPLEDGSLDGWVVHPVALTSMTVGALADHDISKKDAERAKNMFALGLLSWMYSRPHESTLTFLERKFAARPELAAANIAAFKAGWNFGETTEDFAVRYEVKPAQDAARQLPQHHRQRRARARARRRRGAVEAAGVPRRVPDHAGQRHPARAEQAQALQRHDDAGRGRDRRGRRGAGRRRTAARWASPPPAARASRSRARRSRWPSRWSCRWSSSTCSGPGRRPACRPRPSRPTSTWRCSAATARPRPRSSRRARRRTASTPRSRRPGSR